MIIAFTGSASLPPVHPLWLAARWKRGGWGGKRPLLLSSSGLAARLRAEAQVVRLRCSAALRVAAALVFT